MATDDYRKSQPDAPTGFFAWEAAGLRWLGNAPGGAQVVDVIDVDDTSITLRQLTPTRPTRQAAENFGRSLWTTHASGAPAFGSPPPGWDGDGWIGRQPQTMRPTDRWGQYYAEQRVRPFVRAAVDNGNLDPDGAALLDAVCDRIAGGEFDDGTPPRRIHGDLWGGNIMFTDSGVVMIDPAAHGGNGRTDLAMLALFGCPELAAIESAYAEAAALPSGWRRLTGLHQLHPLAVHAVSHGPAYADQLVRTAGTYR